MNLILIKMNKENFTNLLEFTSEEMDDLKKSNPSLRVLTSLGFARLVVDYNRLQKSDTEANKIDPGVSESLVKISVVDKNLRKSQLYVDLSSMLDENCIVKSNFLTERLGISGRTVESFMKGKEAEVGETRQWGNQVMRKTESGWEPVIA